jgi:hypothetical protein
VIGNQRSNLPDGALILAQTRDEAGAGHGRFAAARGADHGDKGRFFHGLLEPIDRSIAAKKERRILLPEVKEATIGSDRVLGRGELRLEVRTGWFATNGFLQKKDDLVER